MGRRSWTIKYSSEISVKQKLKHPRNNSESTENFALKKYIFRSIIYVGLCWSSNISFFSSLTLFLFYLPNLELFALIFVFVQVGYTSV